MPDALLDARLKKNRNREIRERSKMLGHPNNAGLALGSSKYEGGCPSSPDIVTLKSKRVHGLKRGLNREQYLLGKPDHLSSKPRSHRGQ